MTEWGWKLLPATFCPVDTENVRMALSSIHHFQLEKAGLDKDPLCSLLYMDGLGDAVLGQKGSSLMKCYFVDFKWEKHNQFYVVYQKSI